MLRIGSNTILYLCSPEANQCNIKRTAQHLALNASFYTHTTVKAFQMTEASSLSRLYIIIFLLLLPLQGDLI